MKLVSGLALTALLASCSGDEGTIGITVVGAPESEILPQIDRLRATLTNPLTTFEGTRKGDDSLSLSIDLPADGSSGDMIVEGFDSADALIAVGRVGPLPLNAIDAEVVVYMAAPLSVAEAPIRLDPPRSHIGSTAASFGVVFAGGQGESGVLGNVDVYSTYLHSTQAGLDLPAPRRDVAVQAGSGAFVYMIGGTDEAGEASAQSYAFDTTIAPRGAYRTLVVSEDNARAGSAITIVGQELFLVSGDPALLLDGFSGSARPLLNGEGLDGPAVTLFSDSNIQVLFAGSDVTEGGGALYENGQLRRIGAPDELATRSGHRGITLPTNEGLFVGGSISGVATTTAVLYKPLTDSFQTVEFLATARNNPAIAITERYLVVVGGADDSGLPVGDIEVFDASTLDPVAVIAMQIPRMNTSAEPLSNGQVLIAGGVDANGDPVGILELFTPDE